MFKSYTRISAKEAEKMIIDMGCYGRHYNDIYGLLNSKMAVVNHYQQYDLRFKDEVQRCRDFFNQKVFSYENLLGPTCYVSGASVSTPDHITGEFKEVVSGDGFYNEDDYWANIALSIEDLETAISKANRERFLSGVNAGIASIEAFLNQQYLHKKSAVIDVKDLTLSEKIKKWPDLLMGEKFDCSGKSYQSFFLPLSLRNENFQHRKSIKTGVSVKVFEKELNYFKLGICTLLFDLHKHYPEIKYCFINRTH